MNIHLVIFVSILTIALSKDICYDDLGCFTTEFPFGNSASRPISVLPEKPSVINTKFHLYNKNVDGVLIDFNNVTDEYIQSIPTKFFIHGFYDTPNMQMKNTLLKYVDCNFITVDWRDGSKLPYTQATANTQVVGAELARLMQSIIDKKKARIEHFHLIGHSLGAHVSGYAGKRINGIGRISGLVAFFSI